MLSALKNPFSCCFESEQESQGKKQGGQAGCPCDPPAAMGTMGNGALTNPTGHASDGVVGSLFTGRANRGALNPSPIDQDCLHLPQALQN